MIETDREHIQRLNQQAGQYQARIVEFETNIVRLLKAIGQPALCSGCGAEIWWVVHLNGKRAPYTKAGLNHFADCPQAQKFRKAK